MLSTNFILIQPWLRLFNSLKQYLVRFILTLRIKYVKLLQLLRVSRLLSLSEHALLKQLFHMRKNQGPLYSRSGNRFSPILDRASEQCITRIRVSQNNTQKIVNRERTFSFRKSLENYIIRCASKNSTKCKY